MIIYFRNYIYRIKSIIAVILALFISFSLVTFLFRDRLNSVSGQISTLQNDGYEIAYVLNYDSMLGNEFVYVDKDIMLYTDLKKQDRVAASCLMVLPESDYSFKSAGISIKSGEIVVSKNIAENYDLKVGDILRGELSYTSEICEYKIVGISGVEYDLENPNINNQVGIIYMGYDPEYANSIQCQYIIFSNVSLAEELSDKPQIIADIINKSSIQNNILSQSVGCYVFEVFFLIMAMTISHFIFFRKSRQYLNRMILKGMSKTRVSLIGFGEKIIFIILPFILAEVASFLIFPVTNYMTWIYYATPFFLFAVYCVMSRTLKV